MSSPKKENNEHESFRLSLDAWAVIAALILALAIRLDLLKRVPW
jgi:hypothetical protein